MIQELIKEKVTPFYIFDEQGFVNNYKNLDNALKSVYSNYIISYSYKTNYTPYIAKLVKDLGGYAEVVSDMEYLLAKKIGYRNSQIVYNGPSKGILMYEHLENNGILNIDSLDEARRIVNYCNEHPNRQYSCGLRINMNLGDGFISRFGIDPESKDMETFTQLINDTANLKLVGIHCHISRHRTLEAWAKRSEIMLYVADKLFSDVPEYISLGSGMFADMERALKDQFGGDSVPSYRDYARVAIEPIARHYSEYTNKPILFTEPGTTLVARYISFISKVLSIKEIHGKYFANMDGDYHNLGEICTMKKLPIRIIPGGKRQKKYENLNITGFTCLEQDLMFPKLEEPIAVDDLICFGNVGAYSIVSKPQFINPQSPMYVVKPDHSITEIMKAETFDDVFSKFVF